MKEDAEKWAIEQLKDIETLEAFFEMMLFGSVGYRVDSEGNSTKLTQEELWEIKQGIFTTVEEIPLNEVISRYNLTEEDIKNLSK